MMTCLGLLFSAQGLPEKLGCQVTALRARLGIRVSGFDAPKPVETFEQCGLDGLLMGVIKKAG